MKQDNEESILILISNVFIVIVIVGIKPCLLNIVLWMPG